MSMEILQNDADYIDNSDVYVPPVAGLATWLFPRTNRALSEKNYIRDGIGGSVVGNPVFHDGYDSFDGVAGNFIDSGIVESRAATVMCAVRTGDELTSGTTRPYFIGSAIGAAADGSGRFPAGVNIAVSPSNKLQFVSGRWDGSVANTQSMDLDLVDKTKWRFLVGRCDDLYRDFWDLTEGNRLSTASTWVRDPSTATWKIGKRTTFNSSSDGESDIAFAGIAQRVLSDAEVQKVYARVKLELDHYFGIAI